MKENEFKRFLKSVPKAEIHIHIEAVISMDSVKKLYKKRFEKEMTEEEQNSLFSYEDLNGFIQAFLKVQDLFTCFEDFNLVFDDLAEYLVENGITYCEAFFAPSAFIKKGFKYEEMVAIFDKCIEKIQSEHGISVKLLMDVSRTFGCENAMNNYKMMKSVPSKNIIGIGLGGAEQKGPAKEFEPVFTLALKEGFKAVAHAGEDVGPESVWDSINFLHAQRIGHGITSIQDSELVKKLSETQLPLEICITSNTFTKKIVQKAEEHPVREFFDKNLLVTINTDDPVFFKTTLLNEYWICFSKLNFTMNEIKKLILNSFKATFLTEEEKSFWYKKVENSFEE